MNKTRREAMKTGGAALMGTGVLPTLASGTPTNRYVGIVYNPRTKEVLGPASGKITSRHDELAGSIKLLDQIIPVNTVVDLHHSSKTAVGPAQRFHVEKGGEFKMNERMMQISVTSVDGGDVTGLTDYGTGFPKKAFALREKTAADTKRDIRDSISKRINKGGNDE